ncbi:MAG: hypothetical protein ABI306_07500 [Caulobacteraceae bacterium]
MHRPSLTRALLVLAAIGAAIAAPALESSARPKKQPVYEAPPPPPPPPPAGPVGLPDRLLSDAAAYQAYLDRVSATSPGFTSGAGVESALQAAAAYEPKAFIRGAIAYAAVAALEDPTFVAQLRAAGNSPENRRLMVDYIVADPAYAIINFKASDRAAGLAKEALGGAALRLYAEGKTIKQSAYDVQHQDWSKHEIVDRGGRLAAVEASSASPIPRADDQTPALQRAMSGVAPLAIAAAPPAEPPYTPLIARALQVAAIAALGEAGDDAYDRLTALATDYNTADCLHIAKLNLYQCLAVAKPNYEDIFCMGQHAMSDTGSCLAKNAGAAMPIEAAPAPMAVPPVHAAATTPRHRRAPG